MGEKVAFYILLMLASLAHAEIVIDSMAVHAYSKDGRGTITVATSNGCALYVAYLTIEDPSGRKHERQMAFDFNPKMNGPDTGYTVATMETEFVPLVTAASMRCYNRTGWRKINASEITFEFSGRIKHHYEPDYRQGREKK
jgi:hypothetical protein